MFFLEKDVKKVSRFFQTFK